MAMTTDCLTKLKPVVSDVVYAKLDDAFKAGDQKTWDFTMAESHSDMKMIRRDAILDANKRESIITYITAQKEKGIKPQEALLDIISGSGVRQKSGIVSLDKYIEGVRAEYVAMNIDLIDATRTTTMGLRRASNPDFVNNLVKGIFGDADAAIPKGGQAIIDAWHKTSKSILERFNKAGGSIRELKGFNIPVNHYSPSMVKAGEDAWVTDALKMFTLRRMPGMPEISDEALLRKIFKNITEEGDGLEFGGEIAKSSRHAKLGNSHQQFRTLQPKNGASWLEYNKSYGVHSNPVDSMKEYVDSMATEIGLMEVLGTNPRKMVDDMVAEVQRVTGSPRAGALSIASLDQIRSRLPRAEDTITNVFRGLRSLQTITKLPLAGVTAISDVAFMSVRAAYLGMSPIKVFTRQMNNLVTRGDYKFAAKQGLLAEYANYMAVGANRFADSTGFSRMERAADFSMRANGLNHWTNSARATFGLSLQSFLADQSVKSFDELPKGLRSAFERYGFTDSDWMVMKQAKSTIRGVDFLDPTSEALPGPMRAKIIGMIKEETNFAVPEPNAKARATASLGAPTNTIISEVARTGMQFKTFGVSIMTSHMAMMLDKGLPTPTKLAYAASLLTSTAVMGTLIIQLKDIGKGKEPREVTPGLVFDGVLQGGALSVLGDLFFKDPNLFGGLPQAAAGPTASDLNRIAKVMWGTKDEALKEGGDWAKVLYPAVEQAAEELAFPLKLWGVRVAAERLMLDQMRRLSNPDYYSKLRRTKKWLKKERNQEFWSSPK